MRNASIILDAGCGKGSYTIYLSKHNIFLLISTDISTTIIMEARKQTATDGNIKRVRFVVSNIEHLPLKDGVFDAVVCSQVIEHLLADRKGLNELHRVLKPNGHLVISTDNKNNNITKILDFPVSLVKRVLRFPRMEWKFPHKEYSKKEFVSTLVDSGFDLEELTTFRFSLPSPLWKLAPLAKFLDCIEYVVIRLPLVRNWGDILLAVGRKKK